MKNYKKDFERSDFEFKILEQKVRFHKEQLSIIRELSDRLKYIARQGKPVPVWDVEILTLNPAFVETSQGILPAVVYHEGLALSLCPHCERLHDKGFWIDTGTIVECNYLRPDEKNNFVAVQYNDLKSGKEDSAKKCLPFTDSEMLFSEDEDQRIKSVKNRNVSIKSFTDG